MKIAILPARGGSKRLPSKNIRPFCGRPMISYALTAAKDSGLFDEIHVSTDDPVVRETVEGLGFSVPFLRAPELADDHTPLMPVLKWVLERFAGEGKVFEDVCLLLPCSPLVLPEDLRAAYAAFDADPERRPLISAVEFPVPVEWAFTRAPDGRLTPAQPGMAAVRSQDLAKKYYDSGNFAFYPARRFRDSALPSDSDYSSFLLPRTRGLDLDGPDDFELAEAIYLGLEAKRKRHEL